MSWKQVGATTTIFGLPSKPEWAPPFSEGGSSTTYDADYWAPGEPGTEVPGDWYYEPPSWVEVVWWGARQQDELAWRLAEKVFAESALGLSP